MKTKELKTSEPTSCCSTFTLAACCFAACAPRPRRHLSARPPPCLHAWRVACGAQAGHHEHQAALAVPAHLQARACSCALLSACSRGQLDSLGSPRHAGPARARRSLMYQQAPPRSAQIGTSPARADKCASKKAAPCSLSLMHILQCCAQCEQLTLPRVAQTWGGLGGLSQLLPLPQH